MRTIDISSLGMSKAYCKELVALFLQMMNEGWNLDNGLKELVWNEDLKKSPSTSLKFLSVDLPKIYNLRLIKLEMRGVLKKSVNRTKCLKALRSRI